MITYNNLTEGKYSLYFNEKIKDWISEVIEKEGYRVGEVYYIFVRDETLFRMNTSFLHHDTFTDIITFQLSENQQVISTEIYISLDRIVENARKFNVLPEEELLRVMVHGILHLLGYDDHTEKEKETMKAKENYYLTLRPKHLGNMFHVKH